MNEARCDKASEIDPHNSAVWYNKAVTSSKLGDSDEAIKAYAKAIEIDPSASEAWR